ncbi:hypothetical protein CIPAW_08G175900 [Carya illinoinensis]|uniref:C2 domain-containing protein n=1 Tax=Carya illinoinensis TaxID=32201 RepID=A0A8T1PSV6_CARIL|nr:hypothetical protein CIPAW_08G175900 [Carya illinoinensis]
MGNCFSDVEGGKQALGGVQHSSTATNNNNDGHNDAVEFFYRSRGLRQRFTRVELSLSAIHLRDRDIISKELGRTEVILNRLNPIWIEKVTVAFQFEIVQPLVFHVYDVDTKYHNIPVKTLKLKDQYFLGEATCVLSEVLTKQNRSLTVNLRSKIGHVGLRNLGVLTIHAEETVASRRVVEMMLHCSYDPFLRISRIVESGGSIPICKTEVVNNNLNPKWKSLCLTEYAAVWKCMWCMTFGLLPDNPLIIECFDFNSNGKHSLIGKLQKSMADLEKLHEGRSGANLTIKSHHGHKKKEQYSFLDYVSCGFELNLWLQLTLQVTSNGNPRNPDSLHYVDPSGQLNSYQKAIMEVGEVIQFYDSNRRFPAWGFGGKTFDGTISHCFNLNGSAGSFEDYLSCLIFIFFALFGCHSQRQPIKINVFGQVIKTTAQIASQSVSYNNKKYFVLLIITDGVLTDLQEMKDSLVKAPDLPLSILIVGVGGADFGQMEVLDADKGQRLESSTDCVATRDIVQFLPMRDVHGKCMFLCQIEGTVIKGYSWCDATRSLWSCD